MELALITMNSIIEMFILILLGVVILKTGIGDHETSKRLSTILLNVISPCLIIMSYQMDFDTKLLKGLLIAIGLSAASYIVSIIVTEFVIKKNGNPNSEVEKMAVIYSNCGFIGIPLANAVLGAEGVFYMTAYVMVYNLFVWSHGLLLMSGKASSPAKTMKNFIQPSTIAMVLSVLLFVFSIRLPKVIANPLNMVSSMNTPVAMLVSGINLAESDILGCLKRSRTYVITVLKLFVVPLLTIGIMMLVHVELTIALTIIIASACPTGALVTMFAMQYKKDAKYASELFTITTVLSLITIPVIILISGVVL